MMSWSDIPECVTIVRFVVKRCSLSCVVFTQLAFSSGTIMDLRQLGTFGYVKEGLLIGSVQTTGVYVSYFP